jgi:hypothetical protein
MVFLVLSLGAVFVPLLHSPPKRLAAASAVFVLDHASASRHRADLNVGVCGSRRAVTVNAYHHSANLNSTETLSDLEGSVGCALGGWIMALACGRGPLVCRAVYRDSEGYDGVGGGPATVPTASECVGCKRKVA